MQLHVLKGTRTPPIGNGDASIDFSTVKTWFTTGAFLLRIFRFSSVTLHVYRWDTTSKPLVTLLLLRLLSHGPLYVCDDGGTTETMSLQMCLKSVANFFRNYFEKSKLIDDTALCLSGLRQLGFKGFALSQNGSQCGPLYLRTDLWFGVRSGGSVGHIAGVINNLDRFFSTPILLTTDFIPTVRSDIPTTQLRPTNRFWDFPELPSIDSNQPFFEQASDAVGECRPAFIYQRYSINNWLGVRLSQLYQVPFVLEYNGSEVWIARNWGRRLKFENLSQEIEVLNLVHAHVVVVVSRPMKDELIARGIAANKILVNPNGVDPDRYSPDVDPSVVRLRHALRGKLIVGFIGTFGRWHGAEVLAEAFARLVKSQPERRSQLRLLLIGDGPTMPMVKDVVERHAVEDLVVFTGTVSQEDGPAYLAACDVLASPHVPNPDGTPFFGSPTKIFEYMAMGKGIVASDLDQIGEVLHHRKTAWLVKPGDADALMVGLQVLVEDQTLRLALGRAAREEVLRAHSWREHTRRIVEKLHECCGS